MKSLLNFKRFLCVILALFLFAFPFCQTGRQLASTADAAVEEFKEVKASTTQLDSKATYYANYDSEVIEETYHQKSKPELFGKHDASYYPSVNNVLSLNNDYLNELITESIEVLGNVESDIENNQLKKHYAADGQFYGSVSDDALRVKKTIYINHMMSSRHWLGVFAPAGEILTVTVDEKAIEQTKNNDNDNKLSIIIGYPYWENNISQVRADDDRYSRMLNAGRMPYLMKIFTLTETVTKIGSPFGGMVFLSNVPGSVKQNFKITIDGGVDNPSYKLGVSDKSDWQKVLDSPSPMIYIQTQYINFMAPKTAVAGVEDPDNALTFWNNAVMLSNYAMSLDTLTSQIRPVIMMFDNFVPGGSALCYPGLFAAICPTGWLAGALNYKSMTTTAGGWGIIHEMNHNFQYPLIAGYHGSRQWSVGAGYNDYMEITNNVNNVMAFILYTDIAASRTETAPPSNGDWGYTVDPYYNLQCLLEASQSATGEGFASLGGNRIYAYVDLVHNFGVDKFLHFLRQMSGGEPTNYLEKDQTLEKSNYMREEDHFAVFASKFFERDMVDYFTKTLHFNLSDSAKQEIKNLNYKKHFSLQNLYAMGEENALTGKPFIVDSNETSVVLKLKEKTLTDADHFEILSVSNADGGTVINNNDGTCTVTFVNDDEVTFEINYEVWDEEDSEHTTQTLVACIRREVNFSLEGVEFNYNKSTDGEDIKKLIETKDDQTDVLRTFRAGNFSTSVTQGETFTRLRANIVFPKDQQVTFMVYGDDSTALRIGDEIAVCNQCIEYWYEFYYYNDIVARTDNKITVNAKANQPILVEAYCLNTGGAGNIKVQYSVGDSNSYSGIMLTDCVNAEATPAEIESFVEQEKHPHIYESMYDLQDNALDRFYTSAVDHTDDIESVRAIDEQGREVKNPQDSSHKVENIYDGNTNSWFSVPVSTYKLPHYYIFKFRDKVSINGVSVRFYSNSYAIRKYEYYVGDSEDKDTWSEVLKKDNSAGETYCVDTFKVVTGQYFIIKVTEAGPIGSTNFVEINFNQTLEEEDKTNIYSSKDEQFNYSADWQNQKGSYINGSAKATEDGEVSFILEGKDLLLYSENDESEVYIDDDKYLLEASEDIGSPSLFIQGLTDTKHAVKILGKNMVFDAAKTTGKIHSQTDLSKLNLDVADFEYDGTTHKPVISYGGKTLVEDVDYKLTSCENKKLGKVDFQAEGIGFYKGQINSSFMNILNIENLNAEDVEVKYETTYEYSGAQIRPKIEITITLDGEELQLEEGRDYVLKYSNNVDVGTASMSITFKGNYTGSMQAEYLIEKTVPVGLIVGGVAGGTVSVGGVILAVVLGIRRKKKMFNA